MSNSNADYPIKGEIFSVERLEEYANYLAANLKITADLKVRQPLLPRMRDNGKILLDSYRAFAKAIHRKESISPAGEWLTDNFHIVEDQLREIREDLPPTYYKELPKVAAGELTGYPRIYAIALALVAHTDSQLEPEVIGKFVGAYQKVTPLAIGELWALAITLRIALVENLRRISARIIEDHEQTNRANRLVDRLFESAEAPMKLKALISKFPLSCAEAVENNCAYTAQIAKRLRDAEPEFWPVLERLDAFLAKNTSSTEQIVHLSHQLQASNQVSVANIITSMRLLSNLNWRDFFESLSLVDRVLEADPIYQQMDFPTRDRYRHIVEEIGKDCGAPETEIAQKAIDLAKEAQATSADDTKPAHVGYYLISHGVKKLRECFSSKSRHRTLELSLSYPNLVYFGLFLLFFTISAIIPLYYSTTHGAAGSLIIGILFVISIPCSELALGLVNLFLTRTIRPLILPKLDLSSGVPNEARTMVVIPCMLTSVHGTRELLEKIEVHYLGNSDAQLFFGLLTDFSDSASESLPEDISLLEDMKTGIARLNRKYASPQGEKFFLFHRRRQWNPSENAWLGWERKRGKIHEFNRLLRGAEDTSFIIVTARRSLLSSFRFVITLDTDTQLPRNTARKLVGTILHPLNRAHFDKTAGRVTAGYGVLQPRIGISLESSSRTLFARIYSGFTGIDPYTTAVSDVYQDLFREGSYTGKGLYDVDVFEAALSGRVPENTVLSHDLFEGLYARAALLTDIELLDDFPQSYRTYFSRMHRWTRGDWQIGGWLFPWVRDQKGQRARNRLPLISRWKIFDNLRRSLVAPATLLWFVLGYAFLPGSAWFWTGYAIVIVLFPSFVHSAFGAKGIKPKIQVMQFALYFVFLAHQAYVQCDAIIRVAYRRFISKRNLLEWTTAAQAEGQASAPLRAFSQTCWPTELLLAGGLLAISLTHPPGVFGAIFLTLLWMSYPLVGAAISRRIVRTKKTMGVDDRFLFRQIARKTWHYFETFTGAEDHWLPPDNYQEYPKPCVAHRTSPTNIGLYILSVVSARDFGYVSTPKFLTLLSSTLTTMRKLEQFQGHYFNWYDTRTLTPLEPKYISTVDSGNLAGYLLAARQACLETIMFPAIDAKILDGLADTLFCVTSGIDEPNHLLSDIQSSLAECRRLLSPPSANTFTKWRSLLATIRLSLEHIKSEAVKHLTGLTPENIARIVEWLDSALFQAGEAEKNIADIAPWTAPEVSDLGLKLSGRSDSLGSQWTAFVLALDRNISLADLPRAIANAISELEKITLEAEGHILPVIDLSSLSKALEKSRVFISGVLADAQASADFMDRTFRAMNFDFLMDKSREVFTIGYNATERKFDEGLYDLLGSEARLASFVAIAKGDVPQEHWFRLGRQLVPANGGYALVSWTASMFEYLMPLLILRDYENTLLDETAHSVVSRQIGYGRKHRVPWGVSEAGYNARDLQMNYQYGPFGIPGLGLKRGLSHDLVISPYSTLLAAMVKPHAAMKNLKRLVRHKLLTEYGFYESVDYTTDRLSENQTFAVIKSFMAHHQGMSLAAINNVINNNVLQNRFHADPRVRTTRLLLQERIPRGFTPALPKAAEVELEAEHQPMAKPLLRNYTNPDSSSPRVQLLSNRTYSVMVSTAGGGYSKCGGIAVTRWKEDGTRDALGNFIFVKDGVQDALWSATYQPFATLPESYRVTFGEEKIEFRRRDGDISSHTQIIVAPEDNVEIRHLTLTNHSNEPRILEITSYLEPVLGAAANDLSHPAFSNLFVQTEFLPTKSALLAKRRKPAADEPENWGLHVVVTDGEIVSDVQYETDRAKFIGRGHDLSNAIALSKDGKLSNSVGAVLDPVLSLRIRVRVPPNGRASCAFTTGFAPSREEALNLVDRYHDIHSFDRESKLAWTKSQADLRHLNVDSDAAFLYQRLAEQVLYSEPSLRLPSNLRAIHTNAQSSLWPSGISGDLPIVALRIREPKDVQSVRKLLRCHEYLRLKGLPYDFVIINEQEATYHLSLQDEIQQQVRSTGSQVWVNKTGGVFLLRSDIVPEKDIFHILTVARVVISADEPLKEQINRRLVHDKYPTPLSIGEGEKIHYLNPDPVLDLDFFNGIGGFSKNGKEYVIVLRASQWSPAPWINVISNHRAFGFQVSEVGSGFTWAVNSQNNRLTPWSNDPVCDPPGEAIYLRDDETGETWTPTPLPIRGESPYVVRHGQGYTVFDSSGYGIEQSLTLFVPADDTIKISLLKLKNVTKRKRKITITSYTEWVLGTQREKTVPYLICDVDPNSGLILARNPHDHEFSERVAFADMSATERTFTCSRKEFLGRNGKYAAPAALKRAGLSKRPGTDQDPCAVLQTSVELNPGETREIACLLGQCDNIESARKLAAHYRDLENVHTALRDVIQNWDRLLGRVQVKTPDPAMNVMMNRWLLYQTLSCRYWSRSAFYQSGGAYGFRDQLQDCMAFAYISPVLTREHILRAAARQFQEGDVQHWWHPPSGRGIRTRVSDDLLWLPYAVSFYIEVTGDRAILEEKLPFLEAPMLKPGEVDSYSLPGISAKSASLLEHCIRAIDHSLSLGIHNLPFMGTGDWNDGMNQVGVEGKGESIWMGWFLYKVLTDFLPFCDRADQTSTRDRYQAHRQILKEALEKDGWDGDWYKRAYFDDGTPLGSSTNRECRIDSIAQSWAVLSGAGDRIRAKHAMEKVSEILIRKDSRIVLLFTPPFDQGPQDPGYVKGYVPGVRENGGQYTHAAVWAMIAFAELKDGEKTFDLFKMLNPILHSKSRLESDHYKIEPYVIAGDVYSGGDLEGRGGWSWYTGSAAWYYRGGLESILGFHLRGNQLEIRPCIPNAWKNYEITYRYGNSNYRIRVNNPKGLSHGDVALEVDGKPSPTTIATLVDDGGNHEISVTLIALGTKTHPKQSIPEQSDATDHPHH